MANLGHGGNAKEISRKMGINYEDIIDFSANINPLGMSEKVKQDIIKNIDKIEKYPDITYYELKKSICDYENDKLKDCREHIAIENLILGNGAAEVLYNVVRAISPKNALILGPTFSEYEEAVEAVNGRVDVYKLLEENDFKIKDDILNYISEDTDAVFICNPNNPTGVITEEDMLLKILNKAAEFKAKVLIDESFLDFLKEDYSMIKHVNTYDNLIIIKSLTKFFALPGMRIGYSITKNRDFIEEVNKIVPAWNVNTLAEISTISALKDREYSIKSIDYIEKEREFLSNSLKGIKELTVYEPSVNFILFKVKSDINLKEELINKNILIRSCSNYHGLNDKFFRVAVRGHLENEKLISALQEIFK